MARDGYAGANGGSWTMVSWKALRGAAVAAAAMVLSGPALAAEGNATLPERQSWTFAGPFGKFDQAQLQRGFHVYRQVCAACHSMNLVTFRSLAEPGGPAFSAAQVKALAAEYKVKDGPNDSGDMFERPGRPSDFIPPNFANEQAARAALNGAYPPDMSVLAKARSYSRGFPLFLIDALIQYQEHGPDYIFGILTGYENPPAGTTVPVGQYYNRVMPGHRIAMAPPLSDDLVQYTDGSPKTVNQYARDVTAFLMWAAEPKLEERKRTGLRVMLFLIILGGLVYATKKRVWARVHAPDHA